MKEKGEEGKGKGGKGQGSRGRGGEGKLTLMRSWDRAADWLRPPLNIPQSVGYAIYQTHRTKITRIIIIIIIIFTLGSKDLTG